MAIRTVDISHGDKSFTFSLRNYDNKDYIYGFVQDDCIGNKTAEIFPKIIANRFKQWMIGSLLIYGNIVHNLIHKCIGVFAAKLYLVIFKPVIKKKTYLSKASRMFDNGTPLRALIGIIGHLFLNICSFLTLGIFSHNFNYLSGDLERWIIGDTKSDINNFTRNHRCAYRSSTIAACQQPFFEVKKIEVKQIELKDLNVSDKIKAKLKIIIETGDEFAHLSGPR